MAIHSSTSLSPDLNTTSARTWQALTLLLALTKPHKTLIRGPAQPFSNLKANMESHPRPPLASWPIPFNFSANYPRVSPNSTCSLRLTGRRMSTVCLSCGEEAGLVSLTETPTEKATSPLQIFISPRPASGPIASILERTTAPASHAPRGRLSLNSMQDVYGSKMLPISKPRGSASF
ncbi:hypothetical protein CVT26_004567 [Gymnopilus dilepis]|uniref:Uncharacterized protein n=1 Tax=Gymnopilus dilepis TaxID=231916 RepID=A0A409YJA5_9AGAR|nr:hypothetical protein CVT26_004567 [Gymnopilus dilepis]